MRWALTTGPSTPFNQSWYILRTKHLTLRTLATRMKDHLNLSNPLTVVGKHCAHEHHKITKDSVKVLAREDIWSKRKVRETIEIKIRQPAMNRDQGYELPPPHLRWTSAVMWSSSRRSRDLGGWGIYTWRRIREVFESWPLAKKPRLWKVTNNIITFSLVGEGWLYWPT